LKPPLEARRDLTPGVYADFALDWVDRGASIVGGCCEVEPPHIRTLADRLVAGGHSIVRPTAGTDPPPQTGSRDS
jgi:homocysteine S-methyltransferase